MGLNATSGNGNYNIKYWGEYYIDRDIQMAKNAVVHPEPPVLRVGQLRVGFREPDEVDRHQARRQLRRRVPAGGREGRLRRGDRAASRRTSGRCSRRPDDELDLHDPPERQRRARLLLQLVRTSWARAHMDPPKAGKYWRSVIGNLGLTATQWRAGG